MSNEVEKTVRSIETIPETTTMLVIIDEMTKTSQDTFFVVRPAIGSRMLHLTRFEDKFIKKMLFVTNNHILV